MLDVKQTSFDLQLSYIPTERWYRHTKAAIVATTLLGQPISYGEIYVSQKFKLPFLTAIFYFCYVKP